MINFFKKHKLKFISYFLCAFAMALFTVISFSCKTYAYTIDNNGNLVGDNLFNINDTQANGAELTIQNDTQVIVINSTQSIWANVINDIYSLQPNTTYTFSCNQTENTFVYIFSFYNTIGTQIRGDGQQITTNVVETFTTPNQFDFIRIQFYDSNHIGNTISDIMLNKGSVPLPWEPYGVWYSENNYNTLNNQYNDLINSTGQTALQGVLNNSKIKLYNYYTNEYLNLEFTINMTNPNQFDLSQDCPSLSNWLYNYDSELDPNETYKNIHAVYELNGNYTNSFVVTFDTQVMDYQFTCYYSDGTSQRLSNTDYSYNIIANPDNKTMTSFSIDYTRPDYITTVINFGLNGYSYQYGYKEGYNKASVTVGSSSYQQGYINGKDYKVSSYENEINSLKNSINTLKELNTQLREQIEDNLGWSSLFFAFADTPFKVVSNVLGFELFGVNLFATFIGMITVFGVVYLLKKFI